MHFAVLKLSKNACVSVVGRPGTVNFHLPSGYFTHETFRRIVFATLLFDYLSPLNRKLRLLQLSPECCTYAMYVT